MKKVITILGVDQGIANLGYSLFIFDSDTKKIKEVIKSGVLTTKPTTSEGERAKYLMDKLIDVGNGYEVDLVCCEKLFGGKVRIAEMITGVLYVVAGALKCPIMTIQPNSVKKEITTDHRADKNKVIKCIVDFMDKPKVFKNDHEADSLAIGTAMALKIYSDSKKETDKKYKKLYEEQLNKIKK